MQRGGVRPEGNKAEDQKKQLFRRSVGKLWNFGLTVTQYRTIMSAYDKMIRRR